MTAPPGDHVSLKRCPGTSKKQQIQATWENHGQETPSCALSSRQFPQQGEFSGKPVQNVPLTPEDVNDTIPIPEVKPTSLSQDALAGVAVEDPRARGVFLVARGNLR